MFGWPWPLPPRIRADLPEASTAPAARAHSRRAHGRPCRATRCGC
jgi:hypothetical protein